mmetsp:Transcript_11114/g.18165  ORF Transcript_11114/g.18165 Transcript_11114/m.18165 type:complete len:175 (-) Transcript_11114:89-613(-)|eukprot:CAMPEP_0114429290 /NCGR_PEP_ID=MMETSP0103-20121206/9398_1 /TAXON_ID=37642 ORGANISM="Paraphysomonas imperforata, Strain PA2" /NCGR_SAMPLE_ID=MMETSP0103 /ASSEMBLY_ACC=CAM_ASM_000201 /LENGTH=174 /DNA_ID=CAMNT_0001598599 /DNA_START=92 /DNA_END=616 /DNA_ORIENTATION=+
MMLSNEDPRLQVLINRMKQCCPMILDELQQNKRKIGHWAWWVYPTTKEGMCEPPPKTAVTVTTAPLLLKHAPEEWRQVLEMVLQLAEECNRGIRGVLPGIDHDRVRYFAAFWKDVQDCDGLDASWMRSLALQYEAAFVHRPGKGQDMINRSREQNGTEHSKANDINNNDKDWER